MREDEAVESFAAMFNVGFAAEPGHVEKRQKSEKRSNISEKQRKRGAVRTTSISFRCTPEFRALAAGLAKHSDASIADVLDDALAMLAKARNFKGGV